MRKIKLYIACSLDGYIARPDGDLDWLTGFPNPNNEDYRYTSFYKTVDTVIMGGKTYRDILNMDVEWPYKDKTTYVISRNTELLSSPIISLSTNIIETMQSIRKQKGKDIWIVGGGEVISLLINDNLIDEMIITYIPIMLGSGIPLFPKIRQASTWKATQNNIYTNGVIQAVYQLNKE